MSRLNITGGGECRGVGKYKSWLSCVLITGYTICVIEEVHFNIKQRTAQHSTANRGYGKYRQPAVIRSLEHRFIFCVYERKLLVRTPTSAPQWQTADIHLFPMLIAQQIKKFWGSERTLQFITVFTTVRHRSLSCYKHIQSTPSSTWFLSSLSALNCSFYLMLSTFSLQFTFTLKILYWLIFSPTRATCSNNLAQFY
jgi:hypothetical protein